MREIGELRVVAPAPDLRPPTALTRQGEFPCMKPIDSTPCAPVKTGEML